VRVWDPKSTRTLSVLGLDGVFTAGVSCVAFSTQVNPADFIMYCVLVGLAGLSRPKV